MNCKAPIGAQKRSLVFQISEGLQMYIFQSVNKRDVIAARNLDGGGRGGGSGSGCSRRRVRAGTHTVRPRSRHDLRHADVAAVPPGLRAKLAHEVRRKPENQRRQAAKRRRRRSDDSRRRDPRFIKPSRAREVGIGTALKRRTWRREGQNFLTRTWGHGHYDVVLNGGFALSVFYDKNTSQKWIWRSYATRFTSFKCALHCRFPNLECLRAITGIKFN